MEVQSMGKEDAAKEKGIYHVTVVGSGMSFLLSLFKFFVGTVRRNAATLADVVHSLSGSVTGIVVIVFVCISPKSEDEGHDYGHGRCEALATAIIGTVLLFIGFGISWNGTLSTYHLLHGNFSREPGMLALIAALVSTIFREAFYHYMIFKGKKLNSQAVVANTWHHHSDAPSSMGTAVGIGGAILLGNHWRVLDSITVVAVGFFIMKVVVELSVLCVDELLGKSLPADVGSEIQKIILSFFGMSSPHHLRTHRIGSYYVIEVHMRMDGNITLGKAHRMAATIESTLEERLGKRTHVGIHVELVEEIIHNSQLIT